MDTFLLHKMDALSSFNWKQAITRTTHAHDALRHSVPVRIVHVDIGCLRCQKLVRAQERLRSTVESSMKSEHNLYLACEDSPQRAFFFWTFSCSLLALSFYCTIDFIAFSFSMPPTVGYVQCSTPQNTYVAEDQPRCPTLPRLSRSAILPCPLLLGWA